MTAIQAPGQAPGQPRTGQPPPAVHRGPAAVPRRVAFWLVALVLTITMLGFTTVLSFSILLAVLCLFSISRFARVVGLVSGGR
jgi:hypothetical protein